MPKMNIDGMTSLYALTGQHISFSPIPGNFNTISSYIGYNSVMIPFNTERYDIHMTLDALRILNCKGVFIDTPHRCEMEQLLVSQTDEAKKCMAINAIKLDNKGMHGHNTEIQGFRKAFHAMTGESLTEKKIFLIGAGGIGRAIATACAKEKCESLTMMNRTTEKVYEFSNCINQCYGDISFAAEPNDSGTVHRFYNAEIIIHATSGGMFPQNQINPLPDNFQLLPHHIVIDMVYNPPQTRLLQIAEEKGCRTYNGRDVMFFSCMEAFQWWTNVNIDQDTENKLFQIWREMIYNI